ELVTRTKAKETSRNCDGEAASFLHPTIPSPSDPLRPPLRHHARPAREKSSKSFFSLATIDQIHPQSVILEEEITPKPSLRMNQRRI
ncbi:unnamed protein product, partial [Urochloa humidicola]